ncbi:hypothetical protein VZT92_015289 [Zoarces viviparus]|uniref:Uncharacterized protein n=1 Tax=Zoarces viviparus TaxID=48416 RepID=A0AAW1EX18_ZOAVI
MFIVCIVIGFSFDITAARERSQRSPPATWRERKSVFCSFPAIIATQGLLKLTERGYSVVAPAKSFSNTAAQQV